MLLAGVSSHLLARGAPKTDSLDLNNVTIVPAGSASSVPYLVYLARGRDVVRPPCAVLLDSDTAGDDAVRTLSRGGPRRKELLPSEFVVQVGSWAKHVGKLSLDADVIANELEDLISLPVAIVAARNYAVKLVDIPREIADQLGQEEVAQKLRANPGSLFDALAGAFTEHFGPDAHIEKVGFAKEVVAVLAASRSMDPPPGFVEMERNFQHLLAHLAKLLRRASLREDERRLNNRLNRTIAGFLADYPTPTTGGRGRLLVEEVLASVDNSAEGDQVKLSAAKLRRDFELDEDLTEPIDRYEEFRERVEALRYEERFAKQDAKVVVEEAAPPMVEPGAST